MRGTWTVLFVGVALMTMGPQRAAAELAGKTWRITHVSGVAVPDAAKTHFAIGSDGILNTTVGCNGMRGHVTVSSSAISIGPLATTRKACDAALMELEMKYQGALTETKAFAVDGSILRLLASDGSVLVELRP